MKKVLSLTAALLAAGCSLASAQGINLSWDDCGVHGSSSKSFDCASNTGVPFSMILSFIPPAGIDNFLGISAQLDISSSTPALPDWWKHGTGQCRGTGGINASFDFTSQTTSCVDFYNGQAVGGSAYDVGYGGPNRARMLIQAAVPIDNRGPVDPALEYAAARVSVLRSKSQAPGNCAGCTTPVCIVLNSIQLFQPPDALNDPTLTNPANSNYITWQAGTIAGCPLSTPNRTSSWGQVKSLYR